MVERNTRFGEITRPSSWMLRHIKTYLTYRVGFNDYNRLRGWMYILYSANYDKLHWPIVVDNNFCQLNPEVDLRHVFTADINVSDRGSEGIAVSFPSFNPISVMRAPLKATKVTIKIIVTSATPVTDQIHSDGASYSFDYKDAIVPAKEFVLNPDEMGDRDLSIVAVAIEYEKNGAIYKTDPKWLPATVIAMGRIKH